MEAGWLTRQAFIPLPRCSGKAVLELQYPEDIDLDNMKAIPDLLQWLGMIKNDRLFSKIVLTQVASGEPCTVHMRPVDGEVWE